MERLIAGSRLMTVILVLALVGGFISIAESSTDVQVDYPLRTRLSG
jgi:hypothetical protein